MKQTCRVGGTTRILSRLSVWETETAVPFMERGKTGRLFSGRIFTFSLRYQQATPSGNSKTELNKGVRCVG